MYMGLNNGPHLRLVMLQLGPCWGSNCRKMGLLVYWIWAYIWAAIIVSGLLLGL